MLLTGGDLFWDAAAGDFDWQKTTSISPALAGSFPAEPLYVDLRGAKAEGALTLRNARFRAAVLDIAAPLHGRNKDELDGEDIVQNRRTMRIARGVAIGMAVLASAAIWQAIVANQQRREAEVQRNAAITQRGIAERQTAEATGRRPLPTLNVISRRSRPSRRSARRRSRPNSATKPCASATWHWRAASSPIRAASS